MVKASRRETCADENTVVARRRPNAYAMYTLSVIVAEARRHEPIVYGCIAKALYIMNTSP